MNKESVLLKNAKIFVKPRCQKNLDKMQKHSILEKWELKKEKEMHPTFSPKIAVSLKKTAEICVHLRRNKKSYVYT